MTESIPIGEHVVADLTGIDARRLRDPAPMMKCLRRGLDDAGYNRLDEIIHRFEGGGNGFTAVILLAESHAALHTYPERRYLALDVFGCGSADPREVVESLIQELDPESSRVRTIERSTKTDRVARNDNRF